MLKIKEAKPGNLYKVQGQACKLSKQDINDIRRID